FDKFRIRYLLVVRKWQRKTHLVAIGYTTVVIALIGVGFFVIGTDIMPPSGSRDLQLRITSPQGTGLEKSEENMLAVEKLIREEAGPGGVKISSAFVGMHSPNTPINPIFLFTAGS